MIMQAVGAFCVGRQILRGTPNLPIHKLILRVNLLSEGGIYESAIFGMFIAKGGRKSL